MLGALGWRCIGRGSLRFNSKFAFSAARGEGVLRFVMLKHSVTLGLALLGALRAFPHCGSGEELTVGGGYEATSICQAGAGRSCTREMR